MEAIRTIEVLCAARRSVYHSLPGVEVYDSKRDARSFPGGIPVVGHPPCRGWSAYCAHQAKLEPGERELGIWVAGQVKQWGGDFGAAGALASLGGGGSSEAEREGSPYRFRGRLVGGSVSNLVGVWAAKKNLALLLKD